MSAHTSSSRERRSTLAGRLARTGLYVITDDRLDDATLLARLESALNAGADVVQLRDKTRPRAAAYALGRRVAELCRASDALLIVNDDADLALAIGADGVHVGQDDDSPEAARAVVGPDRLVGLSSSFLDEVRAASGDPNVDYLGFGALFPTATKPDAEPAGPDMLAEARRLIDVPIVGIGGVTADNLAEAIRAGADSVAVVSAVFSAPDPAVATRDLLAAIAAAKGSLRPHPARQPSMSADISAPNELDDKGRKTGMWAEADSHGGIMTGEYVDGKRQGVWQHHFVDGSLRSEGDYDHGTLHGTWTWYRASGGLMQRGGFLGDKKEGYWERWDAHGKLIDSGSWHQGAKRGTWTYFNSDGTIKRTTTHRPKTP